MAANGRGQRFVRLLALLLATLLLPFSQAATNVTVAVTHSPPFVFVVSDETSGRKSVYGISIDLLNAVQQDVGAPCIDTTDLTCGVRFQPIIYDSVQSAKAAFLNGSVQLHPFLPVTPQILELGVSLLTPIGTSDLAFLTKQVPEQPSLLYLLQPLDGRSWALTLGSFAIVAASIMFFDRFRAGYGPTVLAGLTTWLEGKNTDGSASQQAQITASQHHHRIGFREASYRAALALTGNATLPPPSHAQRLAHLRCVSSPVVCSACRASDSVLLALSRILKIAIGCFFRALLLGLQHDGSVLLRRTSVPRPPHSHVRGHDLQAGRHKLG